MSVAAVMMVKDEADIVGYTIRHLLGQVDQVIVADNQSTDGTRELLHQLGNEFDGAVRYEVDNEVGYYQSAKMTALADLARELGHEWVVPCDADEYWFSVFGRVSSLLEALHPNIFIADAVVHDHVATSLDNPHEANPYTRMRWRRVDPIPLPKVAARLRPGLVIEQGNHGARYPGRVNRAQEFLTIRHFDKRTLDQFVRKVINGGRAYAATDLPESMGQHWRDYYRLWEAGGEDALRQVFETWFYSASPDDDETLTEDPVP